MTLEQANEYALAKSDNCTGRARSATSNLFES